MKSFKNILAALAFAFAITAAFTLKADSSSFFKQLSDGTGNCIANQNLPEGCQIGTGTACEVVEVGGTFTYYQLVGCQKPLIRP
ncbi:MAG: DUF6520 family protein [Cytophagales bacterium]|nr:DUF6520 family protein [Cytophagales bacterium]